jgi:hypothetical protein
MNEMNMIKKVVDESNTSVFDAETVVLSNKLSNKESEMNVFLYWCLKECCNNGIIDEGVLKSVTDYLLHQSLNAQCDFHSNFKENLKVIRLDFQRTVFPDSSSGCGGAAAAGKKNKVVAAKKRKSKNTDSVENTNTDVDAAAAETDTNIVKTKKVYKPRKSKKKTETEKEVSPTVLSVNGDGSSGSSGADFVQTAIVAASVSDREFIALLAEQGTRCECISGGGGDGGPTCNLETGNMIVDESEISQCEDRFEPLLLTNELLEETYDGDEDGDELNSDDIDDLIGMVTTMEIQGVGGGGDVGGDVGGVGVGDGDGGDDEDSEIRIEIVSNEVVVDTETKPKKRRISKKEKHNGVGAEVVAVVENVELRFEEWFTEHFGLHESVSFVDKSIHISALRAEFMEESGLKITVAICCSVVQHIAGFRDKTNKKLSSGVFSSDGKTFIQGWCKGV